MGFKTPTQPRVHLKDYKDHIVALRAIRMERNVKVNLPEDPQTGEPARTDVRDALLAQIAVIGPTGAENLGQTLVFYDVVAQAVQDASPDWTVGKLVRRNGSDFPYFLLEDLAEDDFADAVADFQQLGIE